jgi:hypothetical protein
MPAEGTRVAARHRPRHLEAGPLFTWPISFLPPSEKKLTCQRSGCFRYAPPNEPRYLARSARILGSALAIASTWFADRRRPAGGTFESGTGIGAVELVDAAEL